MGIFAPVPSRRRRAFVSRQPRVAPVYDLVESAAVEQSMHNFSDYLWFAVVAMGPLLLAVMIVYAMLMRRSLNRSRTPTRRDEQVNIIYS